MNLRISDPKIDELAEELAKRTGENPTEAVVRALEERLTRNQTAGDNAQSRPGDNPLSEKEIEARTAAILEIVERVKKLPVLDDRTPEEMLYDDDGLPI